MAAPDASLRWTVILGPAMIGSSSTEPKGEAMELHVLLTTSKRKSAGSDSKLDLEFNGRRFELSNPSIDDREEGRTDHYKLADVPNDGDRQFAELDGSDFKLVAKGGDAWIPSLIFIIGIDNGAERLLVFRSRWPAKGWFSSEPGDVDGEAEVARLLDTQGTPATPS